MALATLTFPTTIFSFFFLGISLRNKKEIKNCIFLGIKNLVNKRNQKINSGFLRFYGYFLNGEVFSIHRSLYFIL